jgi:hypothetical protein
MTQPASEPVPALERGAVDGELPEHELDFVIGGLARAWSVLDEEPVVLEDPAAA